MVIISPNPGLNNHRQQCRELADIYFWHYITKLPTEHNALGGVFIR